MKAGVRRRRTRGPIGANNASGAVDEDLAYARPERHRGPPEVGRSDQGQGRDPAYRDPPRSRSFLKADDERRLPS